MSRALSFVILASAVAGCGGGGPYQTASVSGKVTLSGKAHAGLAVMFQPVSLGSNQEPGPGSTGITDAEGRYTLKLVGKETDGAVVGKHKVRITVFEPPDDPSNDGPRKRATTVKVPGKYNKQDAILEFDVPKGGTSTADFDLKP